MSHTLVALESLVAVYIIGAYLAKRRRFDYFRPLLDQQVLKAGRDTDEQTTDYLMAMWPLQGGWGEPKALGHGAGRVDLCVNRIRLDPQIAQFFGDENDARTAVIEFEFLVELNSFLAVSSKQAPESHEYMREKYPTIDFAFRPGFIAFDLRRVAQIAAELFAAIESSSIDGLSKVLFDPQEASMLSSSAGRRAYLDFVRGLGDQHERLMLELNRFPGYIYWPKRLQDALNALPRGQQ